MSPPPLSIVSPSISLFLVELVRSAEALQDYGVLVGKVNCNKEPVSKYCTEDRILLTAFLFRFVELLSFDLDTVFDVNAIVSEVLFAILRDEVRYVHTDADLLAMEKTARGKKDIVLGYVSSLGTQEHRSIMETAYVYGSKYQFILITGGPVLKHLGVNKSSPSSQVWFLHCRVHKGFMNPPTPERCPLTRMRKPLSVLSLHSFLQLMEAPLSEVNEDPSQVQPPQFPYQQTPQVFLFSRRETEHLDRDTAVTLAWRLRGLALLFLVHRDSPGVQTPEDYNAAYRLPEKVLRSHVCTETLLFTLSSQLDDEVAASVYQDRGNLLDMDLFTPLNTDNFHETVAQSGLTVALFYLKWDAVSMAFLTSFAEVAERLEDTGVDDVQMSAVDCGEWTDLCAAQSGSSRPLPFQPITTFPAVLLFRPEELAQHYRGMLGSEALQRVSMFVEAAKSLRGELLTGLMKHKLGWCHLFLLHVFIVITGPMFSTLVCLQPELMVENLPNFLSLGKALLLLFVGEEEDEIGQRQNKALVEELRRVVQLGGGKMERFLPCWIHLYVGRTPAGIPVLGSYLGGLPPLPALVLTHLPSGGEIYQYPPRSPIVALSVLQWLQRIEDGNESPAGKRKMVNNADILPDFFLFFFSPGASIPEAAGVALREKKKSF
uniref:Thioredoxin domain containing 16 n=1 Tax=Sphaeramia orbicularis TaxID=375764 RepID=A0A673BKF9_9TELE